MMKHSKMYVMVMLIGIILLILGLFTVGRIGVNMALYKKYPLMGASPLGILGFAGSYQVYGPTGPITTEDDCEFYQVQPVYYTNDGGAREPTQKELENEKAGKELCRRHIIEARVNAKVQDISSAVLLLLLGGGIVISSKFLFKEKS